MHTPRTPALIMNLAIVLASFGAEARAQDADRRNAATWYRQAMERLQALPQETRFALSNWDPSQPPTPELRAMVEQVRPILDSARRGAQQGYSDMGLDYAAGPAMLLPHLNDLRTIARMMRADAYVRLADGDTVGAAQIIGDTYRMSSHVSEDSVLISTLVGMAMFNYGDSIAQFGIDRGMFSQADSAILLQAADQLDISNPFHVLDSIESENTNFIGWLVEQYSGEGGLDAAMDELPDWLMVNSENLALLATQVSTQDALDADLQKLQLCMDVVEETIFTADSFEQAQEELKDWEKQLEAGEYGVFAKMVLPSYDRMLASAIATQDQIARRRVELRKLARGEIGPLDAANAAAWYLQAIEALDRLPPDELRTLRAKPPARAARDATQAEASAAIRHAALLDHAQPIIEILAQAASIERCRFASVAPGQRSPSIAKSWLPGMRELARVLRDDAARLEAAGEHDRAADRLCLAVRMSAHLAQGKSIAESVVAHVIMNEAAAPLASLQASGRLSDDMKAKVSGAAAKLASRDVLGYHAAIAADRDALARAIVAGGRSGDLPIVESFKREKLDLLNADQIVYAIAVWDRAEAIAAQRAKAQQAAAAQAAQQQANAQAQQPGAQPPPAPAPAEIEIPDFDPANSLEDVIDRAALEVVWHSAEHAIESVKRGEAPSGGDLPLVLNAASRSHHAAADVQRLLTALGVPQANE